MMDFNLARHNMVESQIRTNKVTDDRIIAAFEAVPRERFVPKALMGVAYVDEDLDLGKGRALMEPMVFARLLQAAMPDKSDEVLDVACGYGYSTAVLSRLAATVVGIESEPSMVAAANEQLGLLDVDNAAVVEAEPADGYAKQAPFDLIVIAGGVEQVPQRLLDQLADGGRLVTVLFEPTSRQGHAVIFEKFGSVVSKRVILDAAVPMLPEFVKERGFSF